MKQVLIQKGQAHVETVAPPQVEPGTLLVRVLRTSVSVGTEMSGVRNSALPLWKRALKQPENVRKVMKMARDTGWERTWKFVQGTVSAGLVTGYSAAGVVLEVGEGVEGFAPGDRVACAGAQCAHHAEVIRVPQNLSVLIPDGVSFDEAATVTLGAIALQGVRRAQPTLGEAFVVVGLGILGQLTVQFLKAQGCRVIAMDLDPKRLEQAHQGGADVVLEATDPTLKDQVARLTDGMGADGVLITAASPSHDIVSNAFQMCRKKGRVVLVGDVGLNLNRADFYQKEIDFLISTSYGPGRYDHNYEERGLDYPAAYVRWTENRNLREYLRLIADQKIQVRSFLQSVFSVDQAPQAYAALSSGETRPLTVLLDFSPGEGTALEEALFLKSVPTISRTHVAKTAGVRLAIVGPGAFARAVHLPNLERLKNLFTLRAACARSGTSALAVARQFQMEYSTADYNEILKDDKIDAVLIATRHHLHGTQVLQALEAGKHVFVEKPLALSHEDLKKIRLFYEGRSEGPVLLTGYNRRFSPFSSALQRALAHRQGPLVMRYRMNAGYIPADHWVQGPEGGGRNLGEACHIYDLFRYWTGSTPLDVQALSMRPQSGRDLANDNFVATLKYSDGSLATLTYTAQGYRSFPKEQCEIYCDGKTWVMEDYKTLKVFGGRGDMELASPDKGHLEEMRQWGEVLTKGGAWPISLEEQLETAEVALRIEEQLKDVSVPAPLSEEKSKLKHSSVNFSLGEQG